MRRVRLIYGGREFTIPGTDAHEVRARIEEALRGGDPWLAAVSGHGRGTDAQLLITQGTPVAVLEESTEPGDDAGPDAAPLPGADIID